MQVWMDALASCCGEEAEEVIQSGRASAVLCCCSEAYRREPSCRLEYELAAEAAGIRVVMVAVEPPPQATRQWGWLGRAIQSESRRAAAQHVEDKSNGDHGSTTAG